MSERSRGALITVLWSWVAFAATAAWFGHDLGRVSQQPFALVLSHPVPGITAVFRSQAAHAMPGAVPDAYHVLLAAGVLGVAATAVAAVAFAIEAARAARAGRRWSVFALMVTPVVVGAAWIGGIRLLPQASHASAAPMALALSVLWLLLGLAGIAGSTQAVVTVVRATEFSPRTWRIGAGAATAVTAAMLVATGSTIVWGIALRTAQAQPGDASGWLTAMAIMAVTTARAALALISARRSAAPVRPAVA